MELHQKTFTEKRSFYLEDDELKTWVKDSDGEFEVSIDYEDLSTKRRKQTEKNAWHGRVALYFAVFSLINIGYRVATGANLSGSGIWLVGALVFGALHYINIRRYLLIDAGDGKWLFFFDNKPSGEKVEEFISSMFEKRRQVLRDRYFNLNPHADPDKERMKLQWLIGQEVISEEECQALISAAEDDTDRILN